MRRSRGVGPQRSDEASERREMGAIDIRADVRVDIRADIRVDHDIRADSAISESISERADVRDDIRVGMGADIRVGAGSCRGSARARAAPSEPPPVPVFSKRAVEASATPLGRSVGGRRASEGSLGGPGAGAPGRQDGDRRDSEGSLGGCPSRMSGRREAVRHSSFTTGRPTPPPRLRVGLRVGRPSAGGRPARVAGHSAEKFKNLLTEARRTFHISGNESGSLSGPNNNQKLTRATNHTK